MQSLSPFLNGFTCLCWQQLLDLETTPINAAIYGFTSTIIEDQVGGISGFAAGVLAGMVVTKVLDPQNPMQFKDIIWIKTAQGLSVAALVVLGGALLFSASILSSA